VAACADGAWQLALCRHAATRWTRACPRCVAAASDQGQRSHPACPTPQRSAATLSTLVRHTADICKPSTRSSQAVDAVTRDAHLSQVEGLQARKLSCGCVEPDSKDDRYKEISVSVCVCPGFAWGSSSAMKSHAQCAYALPIDPPLQPPHIPRHASAMMTTDVTQPGSL
jgi:hypothetical protein